MTSTTTAKPTKREVVFKAIAQAKNGISCHEIERKFRIGHATASARITELKSKGLVKATEETRLTSANRPAAVYVLSSKGKRTFK